MIIVVEEKGSMCRKEMHGRQYIHVAIIGRMREGAWKAPQLFVYSPASTVSWIDCGDIRDEFGWVGKVEVERVGSN